MKYKARTENRITIYKNAVVNHGKTTLYFSVNLYNYGIYTTNSISNNLNVLENMLLNIENLFGSLKFTLLRFQDILPPDQYLANYIETIRLWDSDFVPSDDFIKNVEFVINNYCLLAINVDESKTIDFNDMDLKTLAKTAKDKFLDTFSNFQQQFIDKDRIDDLTTKILNVGQGVIKPCSEKLLLDYYIKRVFPSYNIILKDEDLDRDKAVLSFLQQDLTPAFGYFEMSNAGVELFGAEAKTTFGTIIDLVEFPEEINSELNSLNHDGLVVNCSTLSKGQAKLKISRKQKDIEFEQESAAAAGSDDFNYELQDYKDLADMGIAAVSAGKKIIEADMHILITAPTVEELNRRRFKLISMLKNQNIIATFAPDQAKTYVDSFVNLRPQTYPYLMDIRYPLSFRLPQGSPVGDSDSKFTSPPLGESVTRDEATV